MVPYRLIKNVLLTNPVLKVTSFIFGMTLWLIIGQTVGTTTWLQVPMSFYNIKPETVQAPANIWIKLAGRRSDLRTLDVDNMAIHIDGSQLQKGKNGVPIEPDMLFLPNHIKLVQYAPANLVVSKL